MATTGSRRSHSALDAALDIFRVRQYFNVIVRIEPGDIRIWDYADEFSTG